MKTNDYHANNHDDNADEYTRDHADNKRMIKRIIK